MLWSQYIRQEVNYSPNVLLIAFPAFTAIFLIAAYYSGLYDKGYKQSQLIRSTAIAALVLLSVYALLPETVRFSRGILILGICLAFILMNFMRLLFINRRYLETRDEQEERQQTVVVAGEKDFTVIAGIMNKAGMPERVLGRVAIGQTTSASDLGTIMQLPNLVKRYPVKEIIFCENGLSFKEIISTIEGLPAAVRNKFHASGSVSIVGSDSRNVSGDFVAATGNYAIGDPINRRNKRLLDIISSVFFIIGLPALLFIKKGLPGFYKNVFSVLTGKKTWIGYAAPTDKLPAIKKGVISSTTLPASMNELPVEGLLKNDEWYASNYTAMLDVKKISRGFKYLHH
jgi:hypothetical protein